jgi:HEAT repeat protein
VRIVTAATIALALGLAGCGDPARGKVVIHEVRPEGQVVVFSDRQGVAERMDAKVLRQKILGSMARARHLLYAEGAEPPSSRLRVEAILEIDTDSEEGRAVVAMRTERDEMPLAVSVALQGKVRTADDRQLLDRALDAAARALDAQAKLRTESDAVLLRELEHGVDDVKITAARLLAARRSPGSGAAITKLLASPRSEVRDAAIGALIELRDPSAVRALIESARSDDPDAQLRIVEALGAIGGEEAAAYLEMLASGSDEPDLRRAAARARERIH